MSDEDELPPQKRDPTIYIIYFLVGILIVSLIITPLLSEEKSIKIKLTVSQNVLDTMIGNCKIYFLNTTFSEDFVLPKHDTKTIKKEITIYKNKNFAVFFECYGKKEGSESYNYIQKKMYLFDPSSNEMEADIEFLDNETEFKPKIIQQH